MIRFGLRVFLLSPLPTSSTLDSNGTVTIQQLPAYSSQHACGRGCLRNNYNEGPDVCKELTCCWNGCYCGTQNQAAATLIVKSCWSDVCGPSYPPEMLSSDISTALSIYDSYCAIGNPDTTTSTIAPGENGGGAEGATTTYVTYLTTITATTVGGLTSQYSSTSNAVSNVSDSKYLSLAMLLGSLVAMFTLAWMPYS